MALTVHGFIVLPKTNIVQIPICESYRHRPLNMLQITHHDHMHACKRNISRSIICGGKSGPGISDGDGGKINGTRTSREQNVPDDKSSSSKTDPKDGKQSNGEAKATTRKTGSTTG